MIALLLGMIQGLTEFLPISSSGHLVLGGYFLGLTEPHLVFDVVVHAGTLVATAVVYRESIASMLVDSRRAAQRLVRGEALGATLNAYPQARLSLLVVLGCIPTAVVGLVFKKQLEALFAAPHIVAVMLLVTALVLWLTRFVGEGSTGMQGMRPWQALAIGLVQGLAIVPGISRSGSTIACAIFLGIERELAARFSFILSIPAILGALMVKMLDGDDHWTFGALPLWVGFVSALVIGYAALRLLIPIVKQGRFHYFAFYLLPVSLVAWMMVS